MHEANGCPASAREQLRAVHGAASASYVARGGGGSLAGLFAEAPPDEDTAARRPGPALAVRDAATRSRRTRFRALALIVSHPAQRARVVARAGERARAWRSASAEASRGSTYLRACLERGDAAVADDAAALARDARSSSSWRGARVPAGTQVLIVNTFNHRDRERHRVRRPLRARGVDRRATPRDDWRFNHFSHGPQGCPGADLALLVGLAALATLLDGAHVTAWTASSIRAAAAAHARLLRPGFGLAAPGG